MGGSESICNSRRLRVIRVVESVEDGGLATECEDEIAVGLVSR